MTSNSPDFEIDALQNPHEAAEAWRRIYADDEPPDELRRLRRRLALGMVLHNTVRDAVADTNCGELPPVPDFITRAADLSRRVRLTPLAYLAEHDEGVALFLIRHPQAIEMLLSEQGDVFGDSSQEPLTPRLKKDARGFLRKMKVIAPLLFDRAELPMRHLEAWLQFLHRPDVLDRLRQAPSVGQLLGPLLSDFCRQNAVPEVAGIETFPSPLVIQNILWQVAVDLVRRRAPPEHQPLLRIAKERLRDRPGSPEVTLQRALAGAAAANPALATAVFDAVESEHRQLQ